jgi:opacity protein-like surface antigen
MGQQLLRFLGLSLFALMFSAKALSAGDVLATQKIKNNADDVLAIMAFSVVPDLTASFLSFDDAQSGQNRLNMIQFAGGESFGKTFPVYVEGSAAFMRYDPTFVATLGEQKRRLAARWNSIALTGGVGLDFPLSKNWVLRPIFNFSLGHLESDLSLAGRFLENQFDQSFDFLKNGQLNAYGLGGSVMLDYTLVKPAYEIDLELRYTIIRLKAFKSSQAVGGTASAEAASVYARYRAPTGLYVMDRPLRYVLELASTTYLGDQRGLLGFNNLSSVGAGIEFDSSAKSSLISRTRIVGRYAFGQNVRGFAIGLAVSF